MRIILCVYLLLAALRLYFLPTVGFYYDWHFADGEKTSRTEQSFSSIKWDGYIESWV